MKKILTVIIVAFATTGIFAKNPVKYEMLYKLNNENTFNSMVRLLRANEDQKDQLMYIFSKTEKKLKKALLNEDFIAADKVVKYNLENAKYFLTEDQYNKYEAVINVSIYNNDTEMIAENSIK